MVPLTFLVIIGTVVLQSATAGPLARRLGVAEPDPKGFLIVGANPVSLAIGKALCDNGFRALVADTHWDGLREARMRGLDTWYGNPLSSQADRRLDLVGIGRLLALSPRSEINVLAAWKFRGEFGAQNLYRLCPRLPRRGEREKSRTSERPLSCSDQISAMRNWPAYSARGPRSAAPD